jgi:hypothetical protein
MCTIPNLEVMLIADGVIGPLYVTAREPIISVFISVPRLIKTTGAKPPENNEYSTGKESGS